jgi:tRNA nucleotidyltransferase (CCA-adding enzyme)
VDAQPLLQRLFDRLSPAEQHALRLAIDAATAANLALYLVGGAVRDLILDRPAIDLDLALEGEVAPIAEAVAAATRGHAVLHGRFGTATVRGPGFHLDLAHTRRETYARPGALPTVEPAGSITEDLARRDFTINAIALRLTALAGDLIDPFHGAVDLEGGLVRVLHERSFQDDATRMLRAARYSARLGFKLAPQTEDWLRRDLSHLDTVSGPRLRRELTLILEEPSAVDAARLSAELGVLLAIHPLLIYHPFSARRWREALDGERYGPPEQLGFCILIDPYDDLVIEAVDRRLNLTSTVLKALRDRARLHIAASELASATPGDAVEILDGAAPVAIWATALLEEDERARDVCFAYLREWRRVKPLLNGDDLLALGVQPGPAIGDTLRQLRRARLEGRVHTREDEIAFVIARLALGS